MVSLDTMLEKKIIEYWHVSKTVLSGHDTSLYARMTYIKNMIKGQHSDLIQGFTNKRLWLTIQKTIQ